MYYSGGASESEGEELEGEVTLAQDVPGRGNVKQQQSAVKLYEVMEREKERQKERGKEEKHAGT